MVITVEGYNGKKNKSHYVATALSAFLAMGTNRKVLAINLINKDLDTIERLAIGIGNNAAAIDDMESRLAEEGIDQLLREADVQKLMKADFDRYVTPVLKTANKFDIASITKNDSFETQLLDKKEALKRVIIDAKSIYEDVVLLLPSDNKEVSDMVHSLTETVIKRDNEGETEKNLVDYSIYCICQGYPKQYEVEGKNIIYLVTNYEDTSSFKFADINRKFIGTLPGIANTINNNNISCMKLTYSVQANDAIYAGNIARFVKRNRELNKDDINYAWTSDMRRLCAKVTGEKITEISHDWEEAEYFEQFGQSFDEIDDYIPETAGDEAEYYEEVIEKPISKREQRRLDKLAKKEEKRAEAERIKVAKEEAIRKKREAEEAEAERKRQEEEEARKEAERQAKLEEARKAEEEANKKKAELEELQAQIAKSLAEANEASEKAAKAMAELEE